MIEGVFYGKIQKGSAKLNTALLNSFTSQYEGSRIVVTVKILSGNISKKYKNWYLHYLVPLFQQGFMGIGEQYTLEEVEEKMRQLSPIMHIQQPTEAGFKQVGLRNIDDLTTREMDLYIDHLITLAPDLNIYVELNN